MQPLGRGLDVVVEGDAVQVTDDAVLGRVAAAFTAKWDGRWQFTARDGALRGSGGEGEALVFAVVPVKVFAHAKGDPFGATRAQVRPARPTEARRRARKEETFIEPDTFRVIVRKSFRFLLESSQHAALQSAPGTGVAGVVPRRHR